MIVRLRGNIQRLMFIYFLVVVLLCISFNVNALTCYSEIAPSTPDSRFVDSGDGTITDLGTNLQWQRCPAGKSGIDCSAGAVITATWESTLQYVVDLNAGDGYATHNDWRLPNIKELSSIVEVSCRAPALNVRFFPGEIDSLYWSSSPVIYGKEYNVPDDQHIWILHLYTGSTEPKGLRTNSYRIRLVRTVL